MATTSTWIDKDGYRARLQAQRDALPEDARAICDKELCRRVTQLPEWKQARIVLTYLSFGSEVETRWLVVEAFEQGKLVACPRCMGAGETRRLDWHVIKSLENLEQSAFGMLEPLDNPATLVGESAYPASIAIVPGLAFDRSGYRIGYGAGYYDRFLSGYSQVEGATSVGLCREVALQVQLPCLEAHDVPVGIVATESRVIRV